MANKQKIVVIGVGQAGGNIAIQRAAAGHNVLAIEAKSTMLSDTCVTSPRAHLGLEYLADYDTKIACLRATCALALAWHSGDKMFRDMCLQESMNFAVSTKAANRAVDPFTLKEAEASYDEVMQEYAKIFEMAKKYLGPKKPELNIEQLEDYVAKVLFGKPRKALPGEKPGELDFFYRNLEAKELKEFTGLEGGVRTQELCMNIPDALSALEQGIIKSGALVITSKKVKKIEPQITIIFQNGDTKILEAGEEPVPGYVLENIGWKNGKFTLKFKNKDEISLAKGAEIFPGMNVTSYDNKYIVSYSNTASKTFTGGDIRSKSQNASITSSRNKITSITREHDGKGPLTVTLDNGKKIQAGQEIEPGTKLLNITGKPRVGPFTLSLEYTTREVTDQVVNTGWAGGLDIEKPENDTSSLNPQKILRRIARVQTPHIDNPPSIFILDPKGEPECALMLSHDTGVATTCLLYIPGDLANVKPGEAVDNITVKEEILRIASSFMPKFKNFSTKDVKIMGKYVLKMPDSPDKQRYHFPPREVMPGYFEVFPFKAIYALVESMWLSDMSEARAALKTQGKPDAPLPPEVLEFDTKKVMEKILRGEGPDMFSLSGLKDETAAGKRGRKEGFARMRGNEVIDRDNMLFEEDRARTRPEGDRGRGRKR